MMVGDGLGGRLRLGSKVGPRGPMHLAPQGGWGQGRPSKERGLPWPAQGRGIGRWWGGQVEPTHCPIRNARGHAKRFRDRACIGRH